MKLSDYVADFIANAGIRHVFGVVGGGAMHLNDSFGFHPRLKYVACHHEQGAAIAAEAYARLNGLGCCLVTTGPGGTNAITGLDCAWIDSIPVIFISGQVTTDTLMEGTGLRQFGLQESNIVQIVKWITKAAVTLKKEDDIQYMLERLLYIAKEGRPGPVWLDIPLNLQAKEVNPLKMRNFEARVSLYHSQAQKVASALESAKNPILIVGNGAREADISTLVGALRIPVITSWTGGDLVADHPLHLGHIGIFGNRGANSAVQKADLLLVIGCRLSIAQIGHNTKAFAPKAKIIMVDVDYREIQKPSLHVDLGICCPAKQFVYELLKALK